MKIASSPRQLKFGQDKRDTLPRFCQECDVRFACHGGCPKDRFIDDPHGEPGLNYPCTGYKDYFGHVTQPMRMMGELLRRNRAPSELMGWYAQQDAERGRNGICSCGSDKKFKRCHGDDARPVPTVPDRLFQGTTRDLPREIGAGRRSRHDFPRICTATR